MTDYGQKYIHEKDIDPILQEDNPVFEIHLLRKKLLRYTRPMTYTDRGKFERDLFFIQQKEQKMKGRNKKPGLQYLQDQKRKEVAQLEAKESQNRK